MFKDNEHIRLDVADNVATVTFTRPRVKNSLDVDALQNLYAAVGEVEDRKDIHVLVMTGEGDAFCAGVNLKGYSVEHHEAARSDFREVAMWWHQTLHRIIGLPKPVVAAVNGIAVGGGTGLTLAADLAFASDKATFLASWMSNGFANDGGLSYTLPKIVGFRRALEFMLTNRTLPVKEALEWGVVNRVYRHQDLMKNTLAVARQLAAGPTHLQGMVKQTFHAGWRRSLEDCTENECANILVSLEHPYSKERLAAFARGDKHNRVFAEIPPNIPL